MDDLTGLYAFNRVHKRREKRAVVLHPVPLHMDDDDSESELLEIVLVLKTLVDSHENVALALSLRTRLGGYALDELGLGQFKELNGLLPRDGGKVAQKVVERIALFDVVEQGLDGNTRTGETRRAVHDLGVNRKHSGKAGFLFSGHNLKIGQIGRACKSERRRFSALVVARLHSSPFPLVRIRSSFGRPQARQWRAPFARSSQTIDERGRPNTLAREGKGI